MAIDDEGVDSGFMLSLIAKTVREVANGEPVIPSARERTVRRSDHNRAAVEVDART